MVFILQRYVFRELIKVFVLATIALTLIMSLGLIINPIREYGVGPVQVLHLLGYFIPITLTFVLPLSALFAAALVYGRFAQDNELDACKASGISLLTLIYPGISLAIIIAIVNLILSFHVVPEFFNRAEKALKADAKQILFRNIQRRGFYKLPPHGERRIYADQANLNNDILAGVVVTQVKGGRIEKIITTESAKISFVSHERNNEVQIVANHLYQIGDEGQGWFYFERLPITIEIPSLLADDIKFKNINEIKSIRSNPLLFYPVEQRARKAYAQFTAELLAEDISKSVNDSNAFYGLTGEPNSVRFTAANSAADTRVKNEDAQVRLSGKVVVFQFDHDTGKPNKIWRCSEALLKIEGDEFNPTVTMELLSPHWKDKDGTEGIAAGRYFVKNLQLPHKISDKLQHEDILKNLSSQSVTAALSSGPSEKIQLLQAQLKSTIEEVFIDIAAELHIRLVFGVGCIPLIMIGIGLGVILRGGHLLSAFGASAIPAGLLVVFMMMGKKVAKNSAASVTSGVLLMWLGFAIIVILALAILRKLQKN